MLKDRRNDHRPLTTDQRQMLPRSHSGEFTVGRWSMVGGHFLAVLLLIASVPVDAQAPKGALATLIESGNRKGALERIRAGADVNEAQPDGSRPIHWAIYHVCLLY